MDKIKIGIPRGLFYFQNKLMWHDFFEKLDCEVVVSPKTNRNIIKLGSIYAGDEMCVSLKNYLGHVASLVEICDYILVPRIDNYGLMEQSCTNFLAVYDLVNNLFNKKILNYNINYQQKQTEMDAYLYLGKQLGKSRTEIKDAYVYAKVRSDKAKKEMYINANNKLNSEKFKILLVGHDYNIEDEIIGKPIIDYLSESGCETIKCFELPSVETIKLSKKISKTLYWKNNRENIGSIPYCLNKIDGIILLGSFPCGPDSIVNELVLRRVKFPILNLVIDDLSAFAGIETRLESFLDIIKQKNKEKITSYD